MKPHDEHDGVGFGEYAVAFILDELLSRYEAERDADTDAPFDLAPYARRVVVAAAPLRERERCARIKAIVEEPGPPDARIDELRALLEVDAPQTLDEFRAEQLAKADQPSDDDEQLDEALRDLDMSSPAVRGMLLAMLKACGDVPVPVPARRLAAQFEFIKDMDDLVEAVEPFAHRLPPELEVRLKKHLTKKRRVGSYRED